MTFVTFASYLIFANHALILSAVDISYRYSTLKFIVFLIGAAAIAGLCIINQLSSIFMIIGLLVAVSTMIFTLHDELDFTSPHSATSQPSPHPLMTAVWANMHALLPGYFAFAAVANLVRDYTALFAFGVAGILLAYSIQRVFWTTWFIPVKELAGTYRSLLFVSAATALGFFFTTGAAYYDDSELLSSPLPSLLSVSLAGVLLLVLEMENDSNLQDGKFGLIEYACVLVVLAENVVISSFAIKDSLA